MTATTRALASIVFVLSIFLGSVAANGQEQIQKKAQPNDERWQSIFDGKTLNGWRPSAPGFFSIEDGAITGRASREQTKSPVFIVWEGGNVKDFRLRFRCRVVGDVSIHLRAQFNGKELVGGYRVNVARSFAVQRGEEPFDGLAGLGEIGLLKENGEKAIGYYNDLEAFFSKVNIREWNDYEIRVIGQHSVVELNGQKITELIDHRKEKTSQFRTLAFSLTPSRNLEFQIKDIGLQISQQSESTEGVLANQTIVSIAELFSELESGSPEKALELLKHTPWLITAQNRAKWTPLHLASNRDHKEVVTWLIANGAVVNQTEFTNMTPLHFSRTAEITRILITAGAKIDAIDDWYRTPMRLAAENKNLEVVNAIIESGGKMDLVSAVYLGDCEQVAKLIQADPKSINRSINPSDSDSANKYGNWSPLMVAVWKKDKKIVQMLLDAGADINDKNELGFAFGPPRCTTVSPLTNAISFKDAELVELLLRNGANKEVNCGGESLMQHIKENLSAYPPEIVALLEKEWPKKN